MPLKEGYDNLEGFDNGHPASTIITNETPSSAPIGRLISMSDPSIYKKSTSSLRTPHNCVRKKSNISLNNGVSIGSICLIRSTYQESDDGTTAHLVPGSTIECCPPKYRKERLLFMTFVLFYIGFLALGAVLFRHIEYPMELKERSAITALRNSFLQKYTQVKDDDLEEFLKAVITANDRGISPLRNATNEMNWSFGQALFFSSTVITTIGYGHVTPLSQTGKIFCMIYAAIGIPLTLVLLSAMVEKLLIPANWLLGKLNSRLGHLYQPFNIRVMHLTIIVIIVIILFFAIPTAVFSYLEPTWGILDAFYYCFISLTTIGLGDYIPGDGVSIDNRSLYKMLITAYLVLGLIAMMLVLTIFYDIPQLNLGQLFTESTLGETEKLRLSGNNTTCYSGPSGLYMPQRNEDTRRAVVRIRPHGGDDSPSPDEMPSSSSQSRDLRLP
ncbi:potassium channel subfamily K member 1 isoform X1 [Musca domestica]|uniref:Potassium channel subfamily K member 1 isoform X1 n=1 Tax=Musca domestica TaxID=7370 RepID=A0A9J7HX85_MUSDO|nr:potassium channel subfamily K member 1 isoform X1 [Musca domestica]